MYSEYTCTYLSLSCFSGRKLIRVAREMAAAAVNAGIASAVIAGASLVGTNVEKISKSINTERNVTVNICNYSKKYILRNPRVYTHSGYSHDPPQPTIRQNTTEACSFTKNPNKTWGCVGVLTYDVADDEDCPAICCIAIMFSVPYHYTQYQNWFALGIFDASQSCDESLYNMMYYNSGPFVRDDCSGSEVRFEKNGVELKGTMSPRAKAIAKIELWDY
ncbi:bryoporin-like isoform X1 [Pygocentrus nattereri]|uniref:Actinoporin-like protein n=2 Tax=Pygocentrus nattereri TaxID=42514 RepID=A0AAR2J370_PYGNA|nr:bryoporin-like isoform X1 [Pygocentrus nattereri]